MRERKKLRGLITIIRNLTVSWEGDCGGIDCDLYKRLRPPPTPLWKHRCFFVHEWSSFESSTTPSFNHVYRRYIADFLENIASDLPTGKQFFQTSRISTPEILPRL